MTTHEARATKITQTLRATPTGTWTAVKVAYVGTVYIHRMPVAECMAHGFNEVWCRIGSPKLGPECETELRGSAEEVAKKLCNRLRAPTKAVTLAAQVLKNARVKVNPGGAEGIYLLHAPEAAAWLGLDEMTAYRAFDYLEETGHGETTECGWRYAA